MHKFYQKKKKKSLAQQKVFIKYSPDSVDTAQAHESLCHDNVLHNHRTKATSEVTAEQNKKMLVSSLINTKYLKVNFITTNLTSDIKLGAYTAEVCSSL